MNCTPEKNASRKLNFTAKQIGLSSAFPAVNAEKRSWRFAARTEVDQRIAGMPGVSVRDTFHSPDGLRLTREVWRGADQRCVMLRCVLRNDSGKDLKLESIRVLDCASLNIASAPAKNLRAFLDQASPMDGMPSAVRLGELDDSYAMAVSGAVWDMADMEKAREADPCGIAFSNFMIADAGDKTPVLCAGFVEFDRHYNDMNIGTDPSRTKFDHLTADAVFNCILPAGTERATSYFLLTSANTFNEAQNLYDDIAGSLANVEVMPSKQPPAIGCTWHFYGGNICEKTVLNELKAIKKRCVPLDVYLIDDFWEPFYGDWNAIPELFPHGMGYIADKISEAGMIPGIWTGPFAVKEKSETAKTHDFFFKNEAGENVLFFGDYMIDPTAPGALEWITELYSRLHKDYGFCYFKLDKLDFCHSKWRGVKPVCHDRSVTLVEAYRRMIAAIRNAVGPDSFICICGGHYGASIGLGDTQRSSGDTYGRWNFDINGKPLPIEEIRFKQTAARLHWRRIWYTNADGMEIRRRPEAQNAKKDFGLSVGLMTDDEAVLSSVKHYFTGGILMCGESLADISDDRLALYRHVIPSVNARTIVADPFHPWAPTQFVTQIRYPNIGLGEWNTVSITNITADAVEPVLKLNGDVLAGLNGKNFLLFELITGTFLGSASRGKAVKLPSQPAHSGRIVKVIPADGIKPDDIVLLGTDLHYSGGLEIFYWNQEKNAVDGVLKTPWTQYPVTLTVLRGDTVRRFTLKPGTLDFTVKMNGKG